MVRPLGEGFRHRIAWLAQAILYTLGMVFSSAAVGLTVGVGGLFLKQAHLSVPWVIVSVLSITYGLREVGWLRLPIPQRAWQVPISWVHRHRYWGSLAYGLCIGLGYLTFIPFPGFYIWQLAVLILGDPLLGATIGGLYGLGRAMPVYTSVWLAAGNSFYPRMLQWTFGNPVIWHRISALLLLALGVIVGIQT